MQKRRATLFPYLKRRMNTLIWIDFNTGRVVNSLLKTCEGVLVPWPILWLTWRTV